MRIGSQVSDLTPRQPHNSTRVELLPHAGPLARPGHRLERDANPSVKVRQHAHVTCSLAQALIARPQRHTGGYDSTR